MTRKQKLKIPAHCKGMTFEEFQKEAFKDPKFVEEYEALRPEFEALEQSIKARKKGKHVCTKAMIDTLVLTLDSTQ